jgi:hypothetical protein
MPAVSYLPQYRIFYGFLSRVKQGSFDNDHQIYIVFCDYNHQLYIVFGD